MSIPNKKKIIDLVAKYHLFWLKKVGKLGHSVLRGDELVPVEVDGTTLPLPLPHLVLLKHEVGGLPNQPEHLLILPLDPGLPPLDGLV